MTTMISEVYEAFRSAGVPEDKARIAAEELAQEQLATKGDVQAVEKRLLSLEGEVKLVKWMLALVVVAEVLPLLKALF